MIRGTTPTHIFETDLSTENLKNIQIVYVQGRKIVVEKRYRDCTLDGKKITIRLSQEETLLFDSSQSVEVQLRVLTNGGDALASRIMRVHCRECLSDEVLV